MRNKTRPSTGNILEQSLYGCQFLSGVFFSYLCSLALNPAVLEQTPLSRPSFWI